MGTIPFPAHGRLVGVDYGHVRVGLAISDPERRIASPLETYVRRGPEADAERFRRLAGEADGAAFVVGLPVHASGEESAQSAEVRQFGKWLSEVTGRPVCFFDERYTSVHADRILDAAGLTGKRKRKRRDALAAQILLTAFLESPAAAEQPPTPLGD